MKPRTIWEHPPDLTLRTNIPRCKDAPTRPPRSQPGASGVQSESTFEFSILLSARRRPSPHTCAQFGRKGAKVAALNEPAAANEAASESATQARAESELASLGAMFGARPLSARRAALRLPTAQPSEPLPPRLALASGMREPEARRGRGASQRRGGEVRGGEGCTFGRQCVGRRFLQYPC